MEFSDFSELNPSFQSIMPDMILMYFLDFYTIRCKDI